MYILKVLADAFLYMLHKLPIIVAVAFVVGPIIYFIMMSISDHEYQEREKEMRFKHLLLKKDKEPIEISFKEFSSILKNNKQLVKFGDKEIDINRLTLKLLKSFDKKLYEAEEMLKICKDEAVCQAVYRDTLEVENEVRRTEKIETELDFEQYCLVLDLLEEKYKFEGKVDDEKCKRCIYNVILD